MITLTGFTHDAFNYLLTMFAPVYDAYTPFADVGGFNIKKIEGMGRPHQICAEDGLCLFLGWSCMRGSMMVLQLIFGMTMTPLSKYLRFARQIVVNILKIALPTNEKLGEYRQVIASRHPALQDDWGTMDSLKVLIEEAPDGIVQSLFYNGWKSAHFVTAELRFAPDGTIPACFYNIPAGVLIIVLLLIGVGSIPS